MDRALGQTVDETAWTKGDVGCRVIIRQHRDQYLTAACPGNIGGLVCAELDERAAFPGTAIEHAHVVSGLDEVGRHRRAHASESDKSKFHKYSVYVGQLDALQRCHELRTDMQSCVNGGDPIHADQFLPTSSRPWPTFRAPLARP